MEQNCFAVGAPKAKCVCVGGREILRFYAPRVLGESRAAAHFRTLCEILERHALEKLAKAARAEFEACCAQRADFLPHFVRVDIDFSNKAAQSCIELTYSHTQGKKLLFLYRLPTFWTTDGALQHRGATRCTKAGGFLQALSEKHAEKRKV